METDIAGKVLAAEQRVNGFWLGFAFHGNQIKFAWVYDLCADTELSAPAKLTATATALKLAGRKGHFKATHKAIGALCGMTQRTVRRAADELACQNYWEIRSTDRGGGANVYTIIPPDERLELWLEVERGYKQDCREWLDAELANLNDAD